jgi:uncharacterized short protein YbdD (DUF466 family)
MIYFLLMITMGCVVGMIEYDNYKEKQRVKRIWADINK